MAWQFDGQDDYAALADAPALTFPDGDWTLAGWIKITSNAGNGYQYFLSWNTLATANSCNWYLYENEASGGGSDNDRLRCYVQDSANNVSDALSTGKPGLSRVWQHLLMQRSGGTITQYVNGVATGAASAASFDAVDAIQSMRFAGRYDLIWNRFFNGQMAEWAKWDRALSAGEIAQLAGSKTPDWLARGLAWYLPMRDKPVELVRRIPIKLIGARVVEHPRHFRPAPTSWAARAQGVAL